jgi:hypothetical protein
MLGRCSITALMGVLTLSGAALAGYKLDVWDSPDPNS